MLNSVVDQRRRTTTPEDADDSRIRPR